MKKLNILIQELEKRITELEDDLLIDSHKQSILIRENKRILVRCRQLVLGELKPVKDICKCSKPWGVGRECIVCGKPIY